MTLTPDDYRLESLAQQHRICAGLFVPFVIHRLARDRNDAEATLTVTLRDIGEDGERHRALRLLWGPRSLPEQPLGVGENTVTEWAALGVACVVASVYAGLRVWAVTGQGDRFDYWVEKDGLEYGLEVSGTLTPDVAARHRAKVRQWGDNPYGVDGYVVVTGFATQQVIFSYHRFEERVG